ncbi:MAG: ATP-binding cassette domain-containing protein [Acetobacteraceae bacterium]|nr:ATP-binding cassette domain-containing protein [Acetobacteraceae bacterium]
MAEAAGAQGAAITRRGVPIPLLVLLAAIIAVAAGPYVLDTYSVNVLVRSLFYAAVALTVDLLWGYLGILTFGQSAFFGIGAYAVGLISTHVGFTPGLAALSLLAGIAASMLVAGIVGWLAFFYGASALYASVISLVLPIVVVQLLFAGGNFTGSSSGLSGFDSFDDVSVETWFWIAGAFLIVVAGCAWRFVASDAGRVLIAVRENEQRCQYLGLDTPRLKIIAFVATAAICAAAGYGFACYTTVVSPEQAGFVFGTELVIWVALGGRGTILGPVLGAVLIDYESAQLSGDYPFVWQLIIGSVFVAVIVLFPRGLLPLIGDALRYIGPKVRPAVPPELVELPMHVVAGTTGPALAIHGVAKHFGSLKVLDGIDVSAAAGELVSLVGPNGAGKTTLIRCIADGSERSAGRVAINGHEIGGMSPDRCVRLGVGRKFQMANVFDTLTVAECLQMARIRHGFPSVLRRASRIGLPRPALHVIRTTGLDHALMTPARLLSHGMKQALELAMVLALEPSVLLLDEPTAGLTKAERTLIGGILVDLAATERLCIVLVEHDLDFVREISSRVIVLHQGRIVLDGSVDDVVNSDLVKQVYAGGGHGVGAAA